MIKIVILSLALCFTLSAFPLFADEADDIIGRFDNNIARLEKEKAEKKEKEGKEVQEGKVITFERLREENALSEVDPWKEPEKYLQLSEEMLQKYSKDPFASHWLADRSIAKRRMKDFAGSLREATKSIELAPDTPYPYYLRGLTRWYLGDFDGAIADYTVYIRKAKPWAYAFFYRGAAYHNSLKFEKAIEDYNKTLELDPGIGDAYSYRAQCLMIQRSSDSDRILKDAQRGVELNPKSPYAYAALGNAHIYRGAENWYDTALGYFYKALEIEPASKAAKGGLDWAKRIRIQEQDQKSRKRTSYSEPGDSSSAGSSSTGLDWGRIRHEEDVKDLERNVREYQTMRQWNESAEKSGGVKYDPQTVEFRRQQVEKSAIKLLK